MSSRSGDVLFQLSFEAASDRWMDGTVWERRIGDLARREALNPRAYRPASSIHRWWGRRQGTVFRAILKDLVPDPARRAYEAPGGLEGKLILDPMMGSGTILQEAIRMGASVIGMDIDPVPVLMVRASLSDVPPDVLREAFEGLWADLAGHLASLWETECPECGRVVQARFVLYARRKRCACGTWRVVDRKLLRRTGKGGIIWIEHDGSIHNSGGSCFRPGIPGPPVVERSMRRCDACGESLFDETDLPFWKRYDPIAVHGACPVHGEFFIPPRMDDLHRMEKAELVAGGIDWGDLDDLEIPNGRKTGDLRRSGVRRFTELFSPRQQIFLHRAVEHVRSIGDPAIRLHMALLVSASLDFNSMLCSLKRGSDASGTVVMHAFSLHAFAVPHLALENNPLSEEGASGSLRTVFRQRVENAKRWASAPAERIRFGGRDIRVPVPGERALGVEVSRPEDLRGITRGFMVIRGTATSIPVPTGHVDLVVTDPPYFDSIQYGDLSSYFRVWLRRMLPDDPVWEGDFPDLVIESASGDPVRYARLLGAAFSECRRVLRENGMLVFTFHHRRPEAWAAIAVALRRGRFAVRGFRVVHSENAESMHIRGRAALLHDAVFQAVPDGSHDVPEWDAPEVIPVLDSDSFVRACARATAALVNSRLGEGEIWGWWLEAARRSGLPVSGELIRAAGGRGGGR